MGDYQPGFWWIRDLSIKDGPNIFVIEDTRAIDPAMEMFEKQGKPYELGRFTEVVKKWEPKKD